MIRFSSLLPLSAPYSIRHPHSNKRPYSATSQESGLCDISYARYSEKRVIQIYKAFQVVRGHHVGVLLRGTNMAAANQKKDLFLGFSY